MRVHHERCCGIDVHKRSVTACLLWGPAGQEPQCEIRQFGTMTADLRALAARLTEAGCLQFQPLQPRLWLGRV